MVRPEALAAEIEKMIAAFLAAGAHAVRAQKTLMQQWEKLQPDAAIKAGIDAVARAFEIDESKRMLSALREAQA